MFSSQTSIEAQCRGLTVENLPAKVWRPPMKISVSDAVRQIDERGLLGRVRNNQSDRIIEHVGNLLGRSLPSDLVDFYREGIASIGDYDGYLPWWNDWVGWHRTDSFVTLLSPANALPIFPDGCGSIFGLDLTPGVDTPAVYFFDHQDEYERPRWAAGSSLGAFLLLYADHDQHDDGRPDRWELKIDPDIDKCPRAPAIWDAD